ncbi:hypothetical protein [Nocardia alni]|uniref:hypothetical protein n=1 Tax=Nocardia alni TaxID=2815723 RepID=UPI001C216D5F|nr:hypothetical protein [Nocardia alni]
MDEIPSATVGPDAIITVIWKGPQIDQTLRIPRPNGHPPLEFRPYQRARTLIVEPGQAPDQYKRFKDYLVRYEGQEVSVIELMRRFREYWAVTVWPDD